MVAEWVVDTWVLAKADSPTDPAGLDAMSFWVNYYKAIQSRLTTRVKLYRNTTVISVRVLTLVFGGEE